MVNDCISPVNHFHSTSVVYSTADALLIVLMTEQPSFLVTHLLVSKQCCLRVLPHKAKKLRMKIARARFNGRNERVDPDCKIQIVKHSCDGQ